MYNQWAPSRVKRVEWKTSFVGGVSYLGRFQRQHEVKKLGSSQRNRRSDYISQPNYLMTYTIPSYTVQPGSVYQPNPISAGDFPIDFLSANVVGCWSTRRLLSTGSGNIIRGRDATTNEQDFTGAGYPAGVVTLASGGDAFCPQLYDQSGNGNHATQAVAANQPKGVNAGSLIVDASGRPVMEFESSDLLVVPDNADLSFTNGSNDLPFSICFYYYHTAGASTTIPFAKATGTSIGEYYAAVAGGNMIIRLIDNSAGVYIGRLCSIGAGFDFYAITYDGSSLAGGIKIYINGVLQSLISEISASYVGMENTSTDFYIGSRGPTSATVMDASDFSAFNKELSQAEVTQLYNALA